jgi:transglutaminase superfamily protein
VRRPPDLSTLRAVWWALRSSRRARRGLDRLGLEAAVTLPTVPAVPDDAGRGVYAILHRRANTCLVRSMVLQAWESAHGRDRDLIVGVTPPARGFEAHAWLEGDPPCPEPDFQELLRRPPR